MAAFITVIWWRDIPAQVIARDGREAHKIVLHPRFQVAIDRAAVKAGLREWNGYLEQWRKDQRACSPDVKAEAEAEAARLEAEYPKEALNRLVETLGIDGPDGADDAAGTGAAAETSRAATRPDAVERAEAPVTRTVLSSATRDVVIGSDRPFTIIGERINPTGRKLLAEEMRNGDFSRVERDAIAQVEAGAHLLDVNAGIPLADEPAILARAIQLVQSLVDVPLSIDSSIVEALEAGLAVYRGKALVNSVTGEEERLERVLPLVRRYGAAVVAISNDDTGISEDPDVRFAVARRIVERAADHGIPREDVIVDPLVMPIGAMATAGRQVFQILRRLHDEALRVNTICGASNISFGLPQREGINGPFLAMAIANGLTCAITNPLLSDVRQAIMAADVLMGNDPECGRWIRDHRDAAAEGEPGRRVNRRRAALAGTSSGV